MMLLRESDDSSPTNLSLEIRSINLRLGFGVWAWGFRILGLGQVLGMNSHGFLVYKYFSTLTFGYTCISIEG